MDVNVVIAARKGDREAYGKLMAEMRPALMAQARAIVKDDYIADECVSETMMRIFDKLPQLRSAGSFPAWARKICTNVCCNEYRRVHRELSLQSVQEPAVSSCYQLTDMYLRRLCAQDAFIVYQKASVSRCWEKCSSFLPTRSRAGFTGHCISCAENLIRDGHPQA